MVVNGDETSGHTRRIGLWGAPGSGKTTLLGAIAIAASHGGMRWMVIPADSASEEFMSSSSNMLLGERAFPPADTLTLNPLRWRLVGETEGTARRRWVRRVRTTVPLGVELEVLEFPEQSEEVALKAQTEERAVKNLAECDGLIYLFDPVRERLRGDSCQRFQRVLRNLARYAYNGVGSRLQHHIAVCVTKFDDPEVYSTARLNGYTTLANDAFFTPGLQPDRGQEFFKKLCEQFPKGNAALIPGTIESYFYPERVGYFAVSAVGFHLTDGRFSDNDFANVTEEDGALRIRGTVRPVGVLDPMLWLGRCLDHASQR